MIDTLKVVAFTPRQLSSGKFKLKLFPVLHHVGEPTQPRRKRRPERHRKRYLQPDRPGAQVMTIVLHKIEYVVKRAHECTPMKHLVLLMNQLCNWHENIF